MNILLCASAWLTLVSPGQGPLSINVDAKTGDTISGEKSFRVTIDSTDAVNQVEFYVGDDLRDTETSTPYVFPLDTVDEMDGDVKVRFKAYTVQSKTVEKVLTLHINNEKGKGADFHVQAGLNDLSDSKFPDALAQGRIALKIDSKSNGARIVLARANMGLKVFDKAQKYAEDAVAQDPKDGKAYQLLAAVDVQRAFNTFAKQDSDRADVVSSIGDALKAAVIARQQSLSLEVDAIGAPTADNLTQFADAANRAERYSLAIGALDKPYSSDPKNLKLGNRLAYAQLRSGRYQDALNTLNLAKAQGALDAYGDALMALVQLQIGNTQESTSSMTAGVESDPDNLGVRTAQAFIALKQNKNQVLSGLATDLAKDQGNRPSVLYFQMAVADRQQRFIDARKAFEVGLLSEPSYPDFYIEQANNSIALALAVKKDADQGQKDQRERQLNLAKMYYQTALQARPEASDALAGMVVVNLLQKNIAEAVRYGEAARQAAPLSALAHYAVSSAYQAAGQLPNAQAENEQSGKLDPINLEGRSIPDGVAVWRYMLSGGRIPVISPP